MCVLIENIKSLYQKGNLNDAYELIEILEHDKTMCTPEDEMRVTMIKGAILIRRGNYKAAEKNLLYSLDLAESQGEQRFIYNRYDNLAALYTDSKQPYQAIEYLKKSMLLKEQVNDEKAYTLSLLQMTSLLFSIEEYEEAKATLKKAFFLVSKVNDINITIYYNIQYVLHLRYEKKYIEAISHYNEIIEDAKNISDPYIETIAYLNQGEILMLLERWDKAEEVINECLSLSRRNQFSTKELAACSMLADIALRKNNISQCRVLYDYVKEHKDFDTDDALQRDIAELGSRLHEAEGNTTGALASYRDYMAYYRQHYDNEQSRTVLYIKARYENVKKERDLREARLQQVESDLKALKAERARAESEKQFKVLIENGTDIIVILNADMDPTYASPITFRTLGYEPADLGRDVFRAVHPDDVNMIFDQLQAAIESPGLAVSCQFRFARKSGRYTWLEGTITNHLQDEYIQGIVCNLKDITERKKSEQEILNFNKSLEKKIEDRTRELQEANDDLEAFSFSVSHDLRSPLRIITGYARMLLSDYDHTMDKEARDHINTILESSIRMSQLIDDLLNFSRLGRKALYRSPVNMDTMVTEIVGDFRKADQTITKDIIIHELYPAHCDMALIRQVWINLISNAIKYSSKKPNPIIEIGAISTSKENIYYVKDNGAGFDMRFAKSLFIVFKRLHDKDDFDGLGVGLALTQRIVKMHEGRIWAEAEVNKGATFYFTLGSSGTK